MILATSNASTCAATVLRLDSDPSRSKKYLENIPEPGPELGSSHTIHSEIYKEPLIIDLLR